MKKKFILSFLIAIVLLVGIETTFYFINRPKYTLHLPKVENVISIEIEDKKIEELEKKKEIINILNGEGRITKEASIQDTPINTEEKLKIDFHFVEKGTSTLFLYKRKNNFYIEQPYNGIYKITEREYEKIKKFSLEE